MAWPEQRRKTTLVFVDFMNLFLPRLRVPQGPCVDTRVLVSSCIEVGESVADDVRVGVYLSLRIFRSKHPEQYKRLMRCRDELPITIFDVHWQNGKDQVDPVIIEDMLRANEEFEADVPFLLASADNGFGPTLVELRQKRDACAVLPINGVVSNLIKSASGWRWIHPVGWPALALYDLLHAHDRWLRPHSYLRARAQVLEILFRLRPGQRLTSWRMLAPLRCPQDPRYWLTPDELHYWACLFANCGILEPCGDSYVVNAHPLVGYQLPPVTTQKPAPQF